MPHTRTPRGKSAVTKGVTSSKSTRGKKPSGLVARAKALQAKRAVPNRGSSRAGAAKARTAAQAGQKAGRTQRGPKETPLRASAGKGKGRISRPAKKGGVRALSGGITSKKVSPGVKRIKGAIITRRAGG